MNGGRITTWTFPDDAADNVRAAVELVRKLKVLYGCPYRIFVTGDRRLVVSHDEDRILQLWPDATLLAPNP